MNCLSAPHVLAGTTVAPVLLKDGVLRRPCMATNAARRLLSFDSPIQSPPRVFDRSYQLQVRRPYAVADSAQVIPNEANGWLTDQEVMSLQYPTRDGEESVSITERADEEPTASQFWSVTGNVAMAIDAAPKPYLRWNTHLNLNSQRIAMALPSKQVHIAEAALAMSALAPCYGAVSLGAGVNSTRHQDYSLVSMQPDVSASRLLSILPRNGRVMPDGRHEWR